MHRTLTQTESGTLWGLNPTQEAPPRQGSRPQGEFTWGTSGLGVLAGAGGGRVAGELLTSWTSPVSIKKRRPFVGIGT